jgi:hypothetical protein
MGKSSRKARRQARKAKRGERRDGLQFLIEAIKNANITSLPDDDANPPSFISKFNEIWPILKPALKFAISLKLTNDNVDKVLVEIVKAGEAVANGGADASGEFIEKFKMAWNKVEKVLELVQILTPNNVDKILDDVMEIGDWIAGE